ncbi:MAG: MerR family DNA-binding protein [Sandaracinaceae bacterium]
MQTEGVTEPSTLKIGELARAADVGVETIRYYERRGLLAQPPRRTSGYRQYPPGAVRRVRFIRRAQTLGFTLKEIEELLALRVDDDRSCADVRALARAKLEDIERRVAELQQMGRALERVARRCRGRGPTSECPILEVLDEEEVANAEG